MNAGLPDWGGRSRFYVPNEDAAVLRAALGELPFRPRNPVFVGGSGMALLEAVRDLPELESAVFVDVAPFQCAYAARLFTALEALPTPAAFRAWFGEKIYPALRGHFLARGTEYPLEQVLTALRNRFGIRFLFDGAAYDGARESIARIRIANRDIAGYLAAPSRAHDFIYLGNVPDYLSGERTGVLFESCRGHGAPVYVLRTSACADPAALNAAWTQAGYRTHPASSTLDAMNRGLGRPGLAASWNRPGNVFLLEPVP